MLFEIESMDDENNYCSPFFIIITTMTSEIKRGEIPIETRLSKVNKKLKSIEKKVLGRLDNIEKELRRIKYEKQKVESYYDSCSDFSS